MQWDKLIAFMTSLVPGYFNLFFDLICDKIIILLLFWDNLLCVWDSLLLRWDRLLLRWDRLLFAMGQANCSDDVTSAKLKTLHPFLPNVWIHELKFSQAFTLYNRINH